MINLKSNIKFENLRNRISYISNASHTYPKKRATRHPVLVSELSLGKHDTGHMKHDNEMAQ